MKGLAEGSLSLLLVAFLSGCSSSSPLPLPPAQVRLQPEKLDAVQSHCFATKMIPNQTEWALLLISPECSGANPEDLVEQTFNLGVISFPYQRLMREFGKADGAKVNSGFSDEEKWQFGFDSAKTLADALIAEDARTVEFIRGNKNRCIHNSVAAEIFSSGYLCSSLNAYKARDEYDSIFMKFCLLLEDKAEPSLNRSRCLTLAEEGYQRRVHDDLDFKRKAAQLLKDIGNNVGVP